MVDSSRRHMTLPIVDEPAIERDGHGARHGRACAKTDYLQLTPGVVLQDVQPRAHSIALPRKVELIGVGFEGWNISLRLCSTILAYTDKTPLVVGPAGRPGLAQRMRCAVCCTPQALNGSVNCAQPHGALHMCDNCCLS
jgi:hypothetical protein